LEKFDAIDNVLTVGKDTNHASNRLADSPKNYDVDFNMHGGTTATSCSRKRAKHVSLQDYQYSFFSIPARIIGGFLGKPEIITFAEEQLAC
jgi:hypothetical protein